jgi:lipopolysaccharide/colanic/teichoic acid biosynthesis glycosyltransferase
MSMQFLLPNKSLPQWVSLKVGEDYTVKKRKCLIIHPGMIALDLIKEPEFAAHYSTDFWDSTSRADLLSTLTTNKYDIVLLDPCSTEVLDNFHLKLINNLRVNQVRVYNLASFHEKFTKRVPMVHFRNWLLQSDLFFVNSKKSFLYQKRMIDLLLALLMLPFALILILLAVVSIKLSSDGPAFFIQRRVGHKGRCFNIYKLRTMYHNPGKQNDTFTIQNDARVTPVGRILRKTKIDELPQLLNILCGHMSLIGPRPEKEDIVTKLADEAPFYNLRHSIRPGVTGWAQVNQPTATPEHNLEKLQYDLFYLKNASLLLDFKILLQTIKVVFTLRSL